MTWPLLVVGMLLALLGLWGGPAPRRKDAREGRVRTPIAKGDAWDILTQPVLTDELIKIPERRAWYIPGRAGRFQRGLMVGLGMGLLIAAGVHAWAPRSASSQAPKSATDSQTKPAPGTPAKTNPTAPPVTAPPQPTTVTFAVAYGDMVPTIATNLKAKGLIADEQAFVSRATERGIDTLFKEGSFTVPTGATLDQVIDALTK